jgi:hypothetical protein
MIGQELQELVAVCAAAGSELDAIEARIRDGAKAASELAALAAQLQREAADVEFEPVTPAVRAHLDGVLLQRVGYVAARSQQAQLLLRQVGQGIRDLRTDCARTVAIAREAPATER